MKREDVKKEDKRIGKEGDLKRECVKKGNEMG